MSRRRRHPASQKPPFPNGRLRNGLRVGELIEQWIDTHERLQNEQLTLGGAHLVFTDPYPQWRREAEALIAQGQKLLDAPDPAFRSRRQSRRG